MSSHGVGEVAKLTGVTVRTLHHYDHVGLLSPSGRTEAGYRLYGSLDLERLQRILYYRELGFPLEDIGTLLNDPGVDMQAHLRRQHQLLTNRIARLRAMLTAVGYEMEARKMGIALTPEERFELFGDWPGQEYEEEAEQRWGESEPYQESQRRVAGYSKEQWLQIKAEVQAVDEGLAGLLKSGADPAGIATMDLVEQHRRHITRWFYDCDVAMHRGLGDMYVNDPRFRQRYEDIAVGLAEFTRTAIDANADRQSG